MSSRKLKIYALYFGDKFVDIGTARELCEKHKIEMTTFRWHTSKIARERLAKTKNPTGVIVVEIGEEER